MKFLWDESVRADRVVEVNVREQLKNLGKTTIVQNAWKERDDLEIHGWVIDIKTGYVRDMEISMKNTDKLSKLFTLD